jgi:1-acyl-sn-glycerol-3-phosphate acyltransferase
VPLVPVAIVGNDARLDESRGLFRPGTVRVVVGPPIATAGRPRDDVPALMEETRVWMAVELARGVRPALAAAPAAPVPPAPGA